MAYHNIHMILPKMVERAKTATLRSKKRMANNRLQWATERLGKEEMARRYEEVSRLNKENGCTPWDRKKKVRGARRSKKPVTLAKVSFS